MENCAMKQRNYKILSVAEYHSCMADIYTLFTELSRKDETKILGAFSASGEALGFAFFYSSENVYSIDLVETVAQDCESITEGIIQEFVAMAKKNGMQKIVWPTESPIKPEGFVCRSVDCYYRAKRLKHFEEYKKFVEHLQPIVSRLKSRGFQVQDFNEISAEQLQSIKEIYRAYSSTEYMEFIIDKEYADVDKNLSTFVSYNGAVVAYVVMKNHFNKYCELSYYCVAPEYHNTGAIQLAFQQVIARFMASDYEYALFSVEEKRVNVRHSLMRYAKYLHSHKTVYTYQWDRQG